MTAKVPTPLLLLILAFLLYPTNGVATSAGTNPRSSGIVGGTNPYSPWRKVWATWYGPGLYGNRTACGQRMTPRLRGIAHRTLPCGTAVALRKGGVRVNVRVVDRGPYSDADIDLTARTAQDLCQCVRPYTMRVWMKRTWR